MKELVTKIDVNVPDFGIIRPLFDDEFSEYTIEYNTFSDIWKVSNKEFCHNIYLNEDKRSKVISRYQRTFLKLNLVQSGIAIAVLILYYLFRNIINDSVLFLYGYIMTFIGVNWFYHKMSPNITARLNEEHKAVQEIIKKLDVLTV